MGFLACEVCGTGLMGDGAQFAAVDGYCCLACERVFPRFKALELREEKERLRNMNYEDALDKLRMAVAAPLANGAEAVSVPASVLREVFRVADFKGDVDGFIYSAHLDLRIIADAYKLFRRDAGGVTNAGTMRGRLENLHGACASHQQHNWPDTDHPIDQTPEEFAKRLRAER